MIFYLGTPMSQLQAHWLNDMPVLVSFGAIKTQKWINPYYKSFSRILLDSGAFSELNSGKVVDIHEYTDFVQTFPRVDAWAGLDDITGNWKRSLDNYQHGGFPTFHDADPNELLEDLISLSRERGNWIGIGMTPPRANKEQWLRQTLERIPDGLHVHGWAAASYMHCRFDSVDSTNWFRDAWKISTNALTDHLTPSEALEIIVKRYRRREWRAGTEDDQFQLFRDER